MASVTRRARASVETDTSLSMEERLQEALERLLARGLTITALSIDALAREAGIARATFYLHFRDKGELVARLIARVEDEVVGAGGLWFVHAEDARFEDLRAAMARFFEAYMKHQAILAAAAETAPYDTQVATLHKRMLERFVGESRQAVQRIAASGRAHDDLRVAGVDLEDDAWGRGPDEKSRRFGGSCGATDPRCLTVDVGEFEVAAGGCGGQEFARPVRGLVDRERSGCVREAAPNGGVLGERGRRDDLDVSVR